MRAYDIYRYLGKSYVCLRFIKKHNILESGVRFSTFPCWKLSSLTATEPPCFYTETVAADIYDL